MAFTRVQSTSLSPTEELVNALTLRRRNCGKMKEKEMAPGGKPEQEGGHLVKGVAENLRGG